MMMLQPQLTHRPNSLHQRTHKNKSTHHKHKPKLDQTQMSFQLVSHEKKPANHDQSPQIARHVINTPNPEASPRPKPLAFELAVTKQQRVGTQHVHRSNLVFVNKLESLDQQLQFELDKSQQLLQQKRAIHHRRMLDQKEKRDRQRRQQLRIDEANDKAREQRKHHSQRLRGALTATLNSRMEARNTTLVERRARMTYQAIKQNDQDNYIGQLVQKVRQSKESTRQTVDQYHFKQNMKMFEAYSARINEERSKEMELQDDLKRLEKREKKWSRKVAEKKMKVDSVRAEIERLDQIAAGWGDQSQTTDPNNYDQHNRSASIEIGSNSISSEYPSPSATLQLLINGPHNVEPALNSSRLSHKTPNTGSRLRDRIRPTEQFLRNLVEQYAKAAQ